MEAATACRPPLFSGGIQSACTSSTSRTCSRPSSRTLLGDFNRGHNSRLVNLNLQRTTSRVRNTITVGAEVAPMSSPFTEEGETKKKQGDLYSAHVYDELTVENVDLVLNEVRPYLISDGGDVEVASVDDGVVSLRLQGACGSCPSSTTTMKMGIERVLNEKFGDSLKGVVQVDQQQTGATVVGVDSHLEMLRPALHNYGGFVQVVEVSPEKGLAVIKYKGPPLASGIQAAIKDAFPDINEVVVLDEHQT
ncbi:unnamed protein product [Calypogeia fissa]